MGLQTCQLATKESIQKDRQKDTKWTPCHFNKMKQIRDHGTRFMRITHKQKTVTSSPEYLTKLAWQDI